MWRRFQIGLRGFFARGDVSTLLITCALMVIPVVAMTHALTFADDFATQSGEWQVTLHQVVPVALLSVIFGFLLSRSHYSEFTALVLSTVYALGSILLVQYVAAPGDLIGRVGSVLRRFARALQIGVAPGSGFDPFILVLFLSILVWFLGHNTAWHTFRLDRVWRAIMPPGIVLVLNAVYNTEPNYPIDTYLIAYVFLSLLLIIRSHIEAREFDWYTNRISFQAGVRRWFFRLGGLLGVALLLLAWALPTGSAEENAKRFQQFLNEDAFTRVAELLNRLFGAFEGQTAPSTDYYSGDKLQLGGAVRLGDTVVMTVSAPPGGKYYWKSRVFDAFQNNEWTSSRREVLESRSGTLILTDAGVIPSTRREMEQRITMVIPSARLIYGAPQASRLRLPVRVDVDYVEPGSGLVDVGVIRPLTPIQRGESYAVVSSISTADGAFLRQAGTVYPSWVRARYLQTPPTLTPRTITLASQIVAAAGAVTPYDQARAIEQWLRQNIAYSETIPVPPRDRDLVDWVLFERREAYCTYYASAMIMMLRSLGIPARMAAGFSQGIYDPSSGAYLVRERDAHTWVEVYFPNAGWVEFEPTSARDRFVREEPVAALPTVTPTPTPTATFTPPPPTNTPNAAGTIENPPATPTPQAILPPSPSPIPSETPTPSATPPPPPSLLQIPPPVQDFLSRLLPFALLLAGLSFAGVGALWWVEYRGLDKLSPFGRAYARLGLYAKWLGLTFRPGSTPLERGRQLAREFPDEGRAVIDITDAYIGERYGQPTGEPPIPEEEDRVAEAWGKARWAFVRRRFGRGKKGAAK